MRINRHVCAGKPHQFWNGDNTTALDMEFTLTPAGTFEQFIRTFCGLASDAGTVDNVSPLQMLVLFPHGDMQLADMPKQGMHGFARHDVLVQCILHTAQWWV